MTVSAKPEGKAGVRVSGEVPVILTVTNHGDGPLGLQVDSVHGPPFAMNWLYYRVFRRDRGRWSEDGSLVPFADGVVPVATLRIAPGDTAMLRVYLEGIEAAACISTFRVAIEDDSHGVFYSAPFRPCLGPGK